MPGFLTNGVPLAGQVNVSGRVNVDTEFARGLNPQSIAATVFQVAGAFAEAQANASTSTAGAVTSNTLGGLITTEALSTAVGATYQMVITNNLITQAYINSGAVPQVSIYSGSNTGGNLLPDAFANLTLQSIVLAVGSATIIWSNGGGSALNGTMRIVWHL